MAPGSRTVWFFVVKGAPSRMERHHAPDFLIGRFDDRLAKTNIRKTAASRKQISATHFVIHRPRPAYLGP